MKRVLPRKVFINWFASFLPQLKNINYKLAVGEVSDRTDGKLVHLDGVNFSRAWALFDIVKDLKKRSSSLGDEKNPNPSRSLDFFLKGGFRSLQVAPFRNQ